MKTPENPEVPGIDPEAASRIDQNLSYAATYLRALFSSEEADSFPPSGSTIVFTPSNNPDLASRNIGAASDMMARGEIENVFFIDPSQLPKQNE